MYKKSKELRKIFVYYFIFVNENNDTLLYNIKMIYKYECSYNIYIKLQLYVVRRYIILISWPLNDSNCTT